MFMSGVVARNRAGKANTILRWAPALCMTSTFILLGAMMCPQQLTMERVSLQSELLGRSEEHTSELQSRGHLVCRLLLEKKNSNRRFLFTVITLNIVPSRAS